MARRSPTNARYQKYTGPEGKTRKSAAAAKPKKASSGAASKSSRGSSKSSKSATPVARTPETPEYRAARKQWWICLASGLVLTMSSMLLRKFLHASWVNPVSMVLLGLAYAAIFYALYVDWTKIRPMRKAADQDAKSDKASKAEKTSLDDSSTGSDPDGT